MTNMKYGNTDINKVYVGSSLVWERIYAPVYTITSYSDPNLYFTINYSMGSTAFVDYSTDNGASWSSTAGGTTSPRSLPGMANGTWIRMRSYPIETFSNILVVTPSGSGGSGSGSGGGGAVFLGNIVNNTQATITAAITRIYANDVLVATYPNITINPGQTVIINTNYSTVLTGATYKIQFEGSVTNVSTSTRARVSSGSLASSGNFSFNGTYWEAISVSQFQQYTINFIIE